MREKKTDTRIDGERKDRVGEKNCSQMVDGTVSKSWSLTRARRSHCDTARTGFHVGMTLSYVNQSRKMPLIESPQIPFRSSFNCRCMLARTIYIFSLSIHISTGNTTPWSLVISLSLEFVQHCLSLTYLFTGKLRANTNLRSVNVPFFIFLFTASFTLSCCFDCCWCFLFISIAFHSAPWIALQLGCHKMDSLQELNHSSKCNAQLHKHLI